MKTLFHGLSLEEISVTQDIFCTDYNDFYNKNGKFDGNEFIWKSEDIRDGNNHLWHQKHSLPCTKVLGLIACRVTSIVLGIGASERSWYDVNTIKYE